ncbi:MAG: DUF3108 domain-containing protein [Deltaproteobacteria bacterium]|nr:DUF3108 domain-containing protein [Deltaproteobacteria bacterium]
MLRWTLVAFAVPCIAPLPATAAPAPRGLEITFDVSSRDTHLGSGKLTIGPKGTDGAKGRTVQLSGKTESLLGVLYQGALDATSWVDASWLPVEAHWKSELAGKKAHTLARFADRRVKAVFSRPGLQPVEVDKAVDTVLLDPVALAPWLMHQKPRAGRSWSTYLYTGMDICKVTLSAGPVAAVQVKGQLRDAVPVSGETTQCRIARKFTLWLQPKDQLPVKLVLYDGVLGTIDFDLAQFKSVDMPKQRPPSADDQGPPAT